MTDVFHSAPFPDCPEGRVEAEMHENLTLDVIHINGFPAPPRGGDLPVEAIPGKLDGGLAVPLDLSVVDLALDTVKLELSGPVPVEF